MKFSELQQINMNYSQLWLFSDYKNYEFEILQLLLWLLLQWHRGKICNYNTHHFTHLI